nr:hypothetical protein [uncultured Rhodoferax sp.]
MLIFDRLLEDLNSSPECGGSSFNLSANSLHASHIAIFIYLPESTSMTPAETGLRVIVVGSRNKGLVAAAMARIQATIIANGLQEVPLVVDGEPARLGLPALREPPEVSPYWREGTGKRKAQWKEETRRRATK